MLVHCPDLGGIVKDGRRRDRAYLEVYTVSLPLSE